jgi:hypothetical protein
LHQGKCPGDVVANPVSVLTFVGGVCDPIPVTLIAITWADLQRLNVSQDVNMVSLFYTVAQQTRDAEVEPGCRHGIQGVNPVALPSVVGDLTLFAKSPYDLLTHK